ncbi:MAG: hypothetical protein AAFR12_00805 [Cyanobacteria bacterium J06626_6]
MSENKSPHSSSDSHASADTFLDDGEVSGAGRSLAEQPPQGKTAESKTGESNTGERTTEQMTFESVISESSLPSEGQLSGDIDFSEPDDMWDVVDLPGTLSVTTSPETLEAPSVGRSINPTSTRPASNSSSNSSVTAPAAANSSERETELLTLIHDLNECNDVLLVRVSQLESALEKSQQIFQNETEKVTEQARIAQDKMAQQASAQQASAQQASQNAQQQIAKVIAQLETAEQALQRQQLINETLQAELNNARDRITQLEHEGALTAQQHAAEAQARMQAETANRDLRSRLQRQQRYTLQFKAALEKSLTVAAKPTSFRSPSAAAKPTSFQDTSNVTMPKAQRIMPWAAAGTALPFEGIDPHLENLIRNAAQPSCEPAPQPIPSTPADAACGESVGGQPPLSVTEPTADPEAEAKLWQDLERVMDNATEATVEVSASAAGFKEGTSEASITPEAPPSEQSVDSGGFTEPSPWDDGQAVPQQTTSGVEVSPDSSTVPAVEGNSSSVSPVVNPLRPKKKPRSLSSIQLPTFEKAKAGSFKR